MYLSSLFFVSQWCIQICCRNQISFHFYQSNYSVIQLIFFIQFIFKPNFIVCLCVFQEYRRLAATSAFGPRRAGHPHQGLNPGRRQRPSLRKSLCLPTRISRRRSVTCRFACLDANLFS